MAFSRFALGRYRALLLSTLSNTTQTLILASETVTSIVQQGTCLMASKAGVADGLCNCARMRRRQSYLPHCSPKAKHPNNTMPLQLVGWERLYYSPRDWLLLRARHCWQTGADRLHGASKCMLCCFADKAHGVFACTSSCLWTPLMMSCSDLACCVCLRVLAVGMCCLFSRDSHHDESDRAAPLNFIRLSVCMPRLLATYNTRELQPFRLSPLMGSYMLSLQEHAIMIKQCISYSMHQG